MSPCLAQFDATDPDSHTPISPGMSSYKIVRSHQSRPRCIIAALRYDLGKDRQEPGSGFFPGVAFLQNRLDPGFLLGLCLLERLTGPTASEHRIRVGSRPIRTQARRGGEA
jgi:hypothetical protein